MSKYTEGGGKWLGAVRSWMQWNCVNGDRVTWGSDEILHCQRNWTPRLLEEIAARVADAAASEMDDLKQQLEDCRQKRLRSEIELTARIETLERKLHEESNDG